MKKIDNGGPAFPVQDASTWQGHGVTMRDYFAAKALQGHCPNVPPEHAATRAYEYADAMMKAREA